MNNNFNPILTSSLAFRGLNSRDFNSTIYSTSHPSTHSLTSRWNESLNLCNNNYFRSAPDDELTNSISLASRFNRFFSSLANILASFSSSRAMRFSSCKRRTIVNYSHGNK